MAELTLEWAEEGRLNSASIRANQPSKHPGVFRIGRDGSRCDLVCVDQTVSGLHIEIFLVQRITNFIYDRYGKVTRQL
ncbi:hypothetical protein APLC1_2918 [Limnospira platensis C1]|nr:hypothetical protein APLC1_2918 [Arthrospira platensis C1]